MKGILQKDFYCIAKTCRMYLLILIVFLAVSLASNGENLFFIFYPAFMIGMIPSTVIAYDERDKWNEYSKTLPYSDTDIVASKYIVSLILAAAVAVFVSAAHAVKMAVTSSVSAELLLSYASLVFSFAILSSSFNLPFVIRFGAVKGRLVTIITSCFVLGMLSFFAVSKENGGIGEDAFATIFGANISAIVLVCGIAIFILSLLIALALYKTKKE